MALFIFIMKQIAWGVGGREGKMERERKYECHSEYKPAVALRR